MNLKKAWHPCTRRNIEAVWLAEQKELEEKKKVETMLKERQQERQVAELQQLQEQAGLVKKRMERLDWMYAGTANQSAKAQEEFLLGKRKVDDKIETSFVRNDKDLESKIREDPLFAIKRKERQIRQKISRGITKPKRGK